MQNDPTVSAGFGRLRCNKPDIYPRIFVLSCACNPSHFFFFFTYVALRFSTVHPVFQQLTLFDDRHKLYCAVTHPCSVPAKAGRGGPHRTTEAGHHGYGVQQCTTSALRGDATRESSPGSINFQSPHRQHPRRRSRSRRQHRDRRRLFQQRRCRLQHHVPQF